MNKFNLTIATLLLASIGLFSMHADAQPSRTVDCDSGDSIQAELDRKGGHSGPITINVIGTCEENVYIRRDDVSVNGNNNAVISGTIYLEGANRITIQNITVTGPGLGVSVIGSNYVQLLNAIITENQDWTAIIANESSSLKIWNSEISNNEGNGVFIGINSSLVASGGSRFYDNQNMGISLADNSSAHITEGTLIQGNAHGVYATGHSFVDFEDSETSNNTWYGIALEWDAAAVLRGANTVSGNGIGGVFCGDNESSYLNQGAVIADPVVCSDFN